MTTKNVYTEDTFIMPALKTWLKDFDEKLGIPSWLVWVLLTVFILRIPSFFEPYYYGDEMIYLTLGTAVRQGLTLYKDVHDNKPPLIYILAAIAGNLFWFKVILAFWNLITIVLFQKLAKVLFPKSTNSVKIATWVFAILTTIPLFEGNIVNSELFMIGFSIAAFLILLKKDHNFKNLVAAGALFSLGTLFKIPAAFDAPVIVALWLTQIANKNDVWIITKRTLYLCLGFAIPIGLTFVWYFLRGALHEYFVAAFTQNVGYLSSFRPTDTVKPFFVRNFPLIVRGLVVLAGFIVLFLRRNKLSKTFVFAVIWLLFSLFAATLSERPYPHYLIQVVPAISVLLAMLFTDKTLEQSLTVIPLALAFFVPFYFKFYYYPTLSYYIKFTEFATGQMSKTNYFESFDKNVDTNYQIATLVHDATTSNDRVFVWEDATTIYALSRRLPPEKYVAGYHINDFSSKDIVAQQLLNNEPAVVVLLSNASPFPQLTPMLTKSYTKIPSVDGSQIFVRQVTK